MRFRVVTGNTARNPVARAIARQKVHDILLTTKLRVYTLEDGVNDSKFMHGVLKSLVTVARAIELGRQRSYHQLTRDETRDFNVLRGGISALEQNLTCWNSANAVAIEAAVDACERLNKIARTDCIADAAEEFGVTITSR